MKRGPFGDIKKFAKKSRKNLHKKIWSWAGLELVLLLDRPQKILQKLEEASLVWQLVEASL